MAPKQTKTLAGEAVAAVGPGQHHTLFLTQNGGLMSAGRPTYGRSALLLCTIGSWLSSCLAAARAFVDCAGWGRKALTRHPTILCRCRATCIFRTPALTAQVWHLLWPVCLFLTSRTLLVLLSQAVWHLRDASAAYHGVITETTATSGPIDAS